jgi:hypothetical protein
MRLECKKQLSLHCEGHQTQVTTAHDTQQCTAPLQKPQTPPTQHPTVPDKAPPDQAAALTAARLPKLLWQSLNGRHQLTAGLTSCCSTTICLISGFTERLSRPDELVDNTAINHDSQAHIVTVKHKRMHVRNM